MFELGTCKLKNKGLLFEAEDADAGQLGSNVVVTYCWKERRSVFAAVRVIRK